MGHDIFLLDRKTKKEELAYLRFSMWNNTSSIVYDLLDSQELNGGVSGTGEYKDFTESIFTEALAKLPEKLSLVKGNYSSNNDDLEYFLYMKDEMETFFRTGVEHAKEHGGVTVLFG